MKIFFFCFFLALTGMNGKNFEDLWDAADLFLSLSESLCVSLLKMVPSHGIRKRAAKTIAPIGDTQEKEERLHGRESDISIRQPLG